MGPHGLLRFVDYKVTPLPLSMSGGMAGCGTRILPPPPPLPLLFCAFSSRRSGPVQVRTALLRGIPECPDFEHLGWLRSQFDDRSNILGKYFQGHQNKSLTERDGQIQGGLLPPSPLSPTAHRRAFPTGAAMTKVLNSPRKLLLHPPAHRSHRCPFPCSLPPPARSLRSLNGVHSSVMGGERQWARGACGQARAARAASR